MVSKTPNTPYSYDAWDDFSKYHNANFRSLHERVVAHRELLAHTFGISRVPVAEPGEDDPDGSR